MENVEVKRQAVPLPPIEEITFRSVYGKGITVKKCTDGDFSFHMSGCSFVLDKDTAKDVVKYLQDMVDGR